MPARHIDTGEPLLTYADEVLVRCHKCGKPGTVKARWRDYHWHAAFQCAHCVTALSSARGEWAGPVEMRGRRSCGYCGYKWLTPRKAYAKAPSYAIKSIEVKCPKCSCLTDVPVKQERLVTLDPHFGLPLRLIGATRGGELWAYNARHLAAIKEYAAATLRERSRYNTRSLFARLPSWIKIARNRDAVLRAIERLEQRLIES